VERVTYPILLLRGAPGVGKTTTAACLRERHGVLVVEVDDLRGELFHVGPLVGLADHERHYVALAQAATMALLMRTHAGRVVVVDTFNAACMAAFEHAVRGRARLVPVSLVADPLVLARRLETRPEVPGAFRDAVVARALNEDGLAAPRAQLGSTTC
jgi:predicted kinase